MNNLNLSTYGVEELSQQEMLNIDGGCTILGNFYRTVVIPAAKEYVAAVKSAALDYISTVMSQWYGQCK